MLFCLLADGQSDCVDPGFSSLKLERETKRHYFLVAALNSYGSIPYPDRSDPIAIQVLYSGDDYFNRGDVFADGFFFSP
ncbi:MAG: hypothetical protein AAFV80_14285, partial [Bacteroidota bacterium]